MAKSGRHGGLVARRPGLLAAWVVRRGARDGRWPAVWDGEGKGKEGQGRTGAGASSGQAGVGGGGGAEAGPG